MVNKHQQGLMGVAVLWFLAAVFALALSALMLAQGGRAKTQLRLEELKALTLVESASLLEADRDFDSLERIHNFSTGEVRIERNMSADKTQVQLLCRVRCGRFEKPFEMTWRRTGGAWHPVMWREE